MAEIETPTPEELEAAFNATEPTSENHGVASFQVYGPGKQAPFQPNAHLIGRVEYEVDRVQAEVWLSPEALQLRGTHDGEAAVVELRLVPAMKAMGEMVAHELVCQAGDHEHGPGNAN